MKNHLRVLLRWLVATASLFVLACSSPGSGTPPAPPATYMVIYDAHGGTGSVPVDSTMYAEGATVTVKAGSLSLTGYTFAGWNTKDDGTGQSYAAGSTCHMGAADMTLYAVWTTNPTFTVTYAPNGGGGAVPVDTNHYQKGDTVTVADKGTLTKSGYTFGGWSETVSGHVYQPNDTFKIDSANVTLTAQWSQVIAHGNVTYDSNGGAGTAPVDNTTYSPGALVQVLGNTTGMTKAGFNFAGWNTQSDGSGTSYAPTATFTATAAGLALYAVWIPGNLQFTAFGTTIRIVSYTTGLTGPVVIPGGVTSIYANAFQNCAGMTGITLPSSLTEILQNAFNGCTGLTSITIPPGVTSIGASVLTGCTGLTSVTIPSGISAIPDNTFYGCTGLTSIVIPSNIKSIGQYAFAGCTGLTSISLPSTLSTIPQYAFSGCSRLTSVAVPDGVTAIGPYAFSNCTLLVTVTLPVTVTSIGQSAFFSCTALTNVTIPTGVTTIEMFTFYKCPFTSITIPQGVTSIGQSAFSNCKGLTSIDLPATVASVGTWAFDTCTSLLSVTVRSTTPPALPSGSQAFNLHAAGLKINVPSGTEGAYKAATGWIDYMDLIYPY